MNNPMILANVKEDFYLNFIKDDRYLWLLDGLKTTLIITVFAVIVGLIIGFLVAIIRSAHDKSGSFKILNAICRVYLTVIRGTPVSYTHLQDICFVPDGDYAKFIEQYTGRRSKPGDFVDTEGNILGTHKGIIHYTLGQRRGLGIPAASRLYV